MRFKEVPTWSYSPNTKEYKKHKSISQASRDLNIPVGSIHMSLNRKSKAYGIFFCYGNVSKKRAIKIIKDMEQPKKSLNKVQIIQWDKNGKKIAEYDSIAEAALKIKQPSSSICDAANVDSKTLTCDGCFWTRKNSDYKKILNQKMKNKKNQYLQKKGIPIVKIDPSSLKEVRYISISQAANKNKICPNALYNAIKRREAKNKKDKPYKGFLWKKDDT